MTDWRRRSSWTAEIVVGDLLNRDLATSIFLPLTERIPTLLLAGVGIAVGNALVNPTMSGLVSQTVDQHHQAAFSA